MLDLSYLIGGASVFDTGRVKLGGAKKDGSGLSRRKSVAKCWESAKV